MFQAVGGKIWNAIYKISGDGDSKAFTSVNGEAVYGDDISIEKLECSGHVQKRMGTALYSAVSDQKSKKFVISFSGTFLTSKTVAKKSRSEKMYVGIGGAQRLTKKQILSIRGHYGAAVRDNRTLEEMRDAIWAIYHHRAGNHSSCPDWCASRQGNLEKAN